MSPSRSTRRSSRRSSILKPPKQRHPLQNLNINTSSNESSPATTNKIKRRVSFAEKKHVKEFCNSLEQGTLWDNTYEEHDLSYPNLSCDSNQQKCRTKGGEEKNIFNAGGKEYAESFIHNKVTEKDLNVEDCTMKVDNVVEDVAQQDELYKLPMDSNSALQSIITYENKDEKLPEKVLELPELIANTIECNELNRTYLQNSAMDFTQVACSNDNYIQNTESEKVPENESMELTQAVLSVVSIEHFPKNVASHESMELTTACCVNNIQKECNVLMINDVESNIENNFNELTCGNSDGTTIFDSVQMEITKPVNTNIYKTGARFYTPQNAMDDQCHDIACTESTKLLDISMEITKPVSINVPLVIEKPQTDEMNYGGMHCKTSKYDLNSWETIVNSEETKIYSDEGMELTTAVLNSSNTPQNNVANLTEDSPNLYNSILHSCRNESVNYTIYQNNSMTMTNVMSTMNALKHQELGRTIIFPNTSMEITDVAPILQSHSKCDSNPITGLMLSESIRSTHVSKDSLSHADIKSKNVCVTTTPLKNLYENTKESTQIQIQASANSKSSSELGRTIIFPNTSMEITDVAPILQSYSKCDSNPITGLMLSESIRSTYVSKDSLSHADIKSKNVSVTTTPLKNLYENTEESTQIQIQASANSKPSTVLQESLCQNNICQSNEAKVSISSNVVQLSENENLKNITPHSRRTYTIQPINNGESFVIGNEERNRNSTIENDINILSMENIEELESIKPPSFLYLDDSSQADISMNVNEEITTDPNCSLPKGNKECEDSPICNLANVDQKDSRNEYIRKSQTFLISNTLLNHRPDNLQIGMEKETNIRKIETLQLLKAEDTRTDTAILISSSPEECFEVDVEGDQTKSHLDENDVQYQCVECTSPNIEKIFNPKDTDKSIDVDINETSNMQLEGSLIPESSSSTVNVSAKMDPFSILSAELKMCSRSDDVIWDVYHESVQRNMFIVGFISCSLLVVIYLRGTCEVLSEQYLEEIKIISRLADDADIIISLIHRIILQRLDCKLLLNSYKYRVDIFPLLNHISEEVKLAMDFMFELKRLNDINLMEITRESISFVSRTKGKDIILKITIDVKPFERIEAQNISVHCLLGSVKEEEIKKLITNVKRDHKFLRRYINDVKDYMYLVDETDIVEESY